MKGNKKSCINYYATLSNQSAILWVLRQSFLPYKDL